MQDLHLHHIYASHGWYRMSLRSTEWKLFPKGKFFATCVFWQLEQSIPENGILSMKA